MKIIAHRGNINGPKSEFENSPNYIDIALKTYDCEIDVWVIGNNVLLGHDYGKYEVDHKWLDQRKNKLWIHCKNYGAMNLFCGTTFNYFWHDTDDYTMTSAGYIWAYPGKENVRDRTVLVMPERVWSKEYYTKIKCFGICSDYCVL